MTTKRRRTYGMLREIGIGALILCCGASPALAQDSLQALRDSLRVLQERDSALVRVGEAAPRVQEATQRAQKAAQRLQEVAEQAQVQAMAAADQSLKAAQLSMALYARRHQSVPQDVQIMRTIVRTALSNVQAPELPKDISGDSAGVHGATVVAPSGRNVVVYSNVRGLSYLGGGDVSGFYMQGYGYLFTVHWPVGSAIRFPNIRIAEGGRVERLGGDARAKELHAWAVKYRQQLSDALRDVIAGYGSTLHRAKPGEAITFLADFGGGDSAAVTMTVKADALHGTDVNANRAAVHVSVGQAGMSESLHTQLKIMSQIIDTSLNPDHSDRDFYAQAWSTYYGGRADPQYVPGYGVIFRKTARLNTARTFVRISESSRNKTSADSAEAVARKRYQAHLDTLKSKTVAILATYGPTLTGLKDDDWVGVYYDVGPVASLLNVGSDNYLVQARMRDIRQAATQSDPAAWLKTRVVTNEKGG